MKISIVIPVYNTEKYLERCVNSIIDQIENECEIILVNDGSTDNSGIICNEFSSKYPEYISVIHKENGGLSSARNYGIKKAKGKYILLVDSDDYLVQGLIKILTNEIKTDKDIYEFGYKIYINNKEKKVIYPYISENNDSTNYLINSLKKQNYEWYPWKCLIKKSLYEKNNLLYPLNKKYEDVFLIPRLYNKARSIKGVKTIGYHYFLGRPGAITTEINYKTEIDKLYVISENIKYFKEKCSKELSDLLCNNFAKIYCSSLVLLYCIKDKAERQHLYEELERKKEITKFILDGQHKVIKILLLIFGIKITAKLLYFRKKIKDIL